VLRFNVHPPEVVYSHLGQTIILNCESVGNPAPNITWYHGNERMMSSGRYEMTRDSSELILNDVKEEDYGKYSCVAENSKAKLAHNFTLSMLGKSPIEHIIHLGISQLPRYYLYS
jgi:hypothetical protein